MTFEYIVPGCPDDEIDRRATRGLPAPWVPSAYNSVLDPALNRVVVKVSPYPGMACGDRLVLSWTGIGTEGSVYRHQAQRFVSHGQLGREITFIVGAAHLAALDGGSLELSYCLSTVLRTGSVESQRLNLQVGDASLELPAPIVDDAVGGSLDPDRVPEGASVTIRPYAGMAIGDRVRFSWEGKAQEASFRDFLIIEAFAVGGEISFWVAPQYLGVNLGSTVSLSYVVERAGQVAGCSAHTTLKISARVLGTLAAPQVLEVKEGALALQQALDGVTVMIEGADVQAGEVVYLKCDGVQFSHRDYLEATGIAALEPLVFIVPYRFWSEHQGTTVRLAYSVERLDDVSQQSEVLALQVL